MVMLYSSNWCHRQMIDGNKIWYRGNVIVALGMQNWRFHILKTKDGKIWQNESDREKARVRAKKVRRSGVVLYCNEVKTDYSKIDALMSINSNFSIRESEET